MKFNKSFEKNIEKSIARNIDDFIARYPNYQFTGYFIDCPDYFIDCYEWYCPVGCAATDCPDKPKKNQLPILLPSLFTQAKCPKQKKRLYMRGHIGELTQDEVKFIATHSTKLIVFRPAADISFDTPEKEHEHSALLAEFKTVKAADRQGLPRPTRQQITIAESLIKLAANLRSTRKKAWGYSLVVGNVPGIPIGQPSTTNEAAKPERAPGKSKYDDLVAAPLEQSIEDVATGKAAKLIKIKEIVAIIKQSDLFKDDDTEPTDSSIEKGVKRNPAWKNRKKALAKKRREEGLGET